MIKSIALFLSFLLTFISPDQVVYTAACIIASQYSAEEDNKKWLNDCTIRCKIDYFFQIFMNAVHF